MIKRIVVAGSRIFNDYKKFKTQMDSILRFYDKTEEILIISGGCQGTDALGERYAIENGIETEIFKACWEKYGLAAGPIRNEKMVRSCDVVICFWDGKSKGSKSLIDLAKKYKKPIKIIFI